MLPNIAGTSEDGEMYFRHVAPHEIRQAWPVVLGGIQKIREDNKESWLPEDVYAALQSSKASLYLFHDKQGAFAGFGVFEVLFMPFDTNPALNIWLGYSEGRGKGEYGIEVAKRVAGDAGIGRVVFSTPQESAWVKNPAFRKLTAWYEVN